MRHFEFVVALGLAILLSPATGHAQVTITDPANGQDSLIFGLFVTGSEQDKKAIERAAKDDNVKGMLLAVDSPGGLVADSHQIYHRLKKFAEKKPIYVQMKRMAASGGYYIAMGAGTKGRIFAEPTTWTGSIESWRKRRPGCGKVSRRGGRAMRGAFARSRRCAPSGRTIGRSRARSA